MQQKELKQYSIILIHDYDGSTESLELISSSFNREEIEEELAEWLKWSHRRWTNTLYEFYNGLHLKFVETVLYRINYRINLDGNT